MEALRDWFGFLEKKMYSNPRNSPSMFLFEHNVKINETLLGRYSVILEAACEKKNVLGAMGWF